MSLSGLHSCWRGQLKLCVNNGHMHGFSVTLLTIGVNDLASRQSWLAMNGCESVHQN